MSKKSTHGAYPAYHRFPRKLKKKLPNMYKRNLFVDKADYYNMDTFMWLFRRDTVDVRNMRVTMLYPLVASDNELNAWYKLHYPQDIGKQQLCFSKRTQVIYPF